MNVGALASRAGQLHSPAGSRHEKRPVEITIGTWDDASFWISRASSTSRPLQMASRLAHNGPSWTLREPTQRRPQARVLQRHEVEVETPDVMPPGSPPDKSKSFSSSTKDYPTTRSLTGSFCHHGQSRTTSPLYLPSWTPPQGTKPYSRPDKTAFLPGAAILPTNSRQYLRSDRSKGGPSGHARESVTRRNVVQATTVVGLTGHYLSQPRAPQY